MIGYLNGLVKSQNVENIILDVSGVGYLVHTNIRPGVGEKAELFIYTAMRQDNISLWGFATEAELTLFQLLISVSGVGFKTAYGLMNAMPMGQIINSIAQGESKSLKAPGIGAKTASRIVIDLKDKVERFEELVTLSSNTDQNQSGLTQAQKDELFQAMLGLGYSQQEVRHSLSQLIEQQGLIIEDMDTGELVKLLLQRV